MIKHLILVALISFSLQMENCFSPMKYCKRCNTDFYTLIEHQDYKSKVSECIKNSKYEKIKTVDANCIDADDPYEQCKECKRDYVVASDGKKCIPVPHCQVRDDDKCQTCFNPFAKNDNDRTCEKKPLCKEIKDNKCKDCIYYYYPNADGECKSIPLEDCMVGDDKKCTQCNTNVAYLDGDVCKKIPEHCNYFIQADKICQRCDNRYYVSTDKKKCESITISNCIQANDATTCSVCDNKYYLVSNNECKSIPISNCLQASDEKTCTLCEDNYFVNKDNTCSKIPDHCTSFSNQKCYQCADTYYLNEDKTECKSITINNCLRANDDKTCSYCKDKYYLVNNNECKSIPIDNCLQASDDKTCTTCATGFYKDKDNKCKAISIDNCNIQTDDKKCSQCKAGYDLNKDGDADKCIKMCMEEQEVCTQCNSNYDSFDYGGSCEVLDPSKVPPAPKSDEFSSFINFNLVIAALILSLIL